MIYFLQEDEPGRDRIKIGFTGRDDVTARVNQLKTASPSRIKLIAVMDGDKDKELALHRIFAKDRVTGEWFNPSPELIIFINAFTDCAAPVTENKTSDPDSQPELAREILSLLDRGARIEKATNGYYRLRWQAKDKNGNPLISPTGSYIRHSRYVPTELVSLIADRIKETVK